jgi:hypothetical protein
MKGQSGRKPKRTYAPPTLIVHGDLRTLTQGGGGTDRESGGPTAPKSKATGTTA